MHFLSLLTTCLAVVFGFIWSLLIFNLDQFIVSTIKKKKQNTKISHKKTDFKTVGEEAIRVLKSSPKWIPAKVNNEIVRYQYVLPIQINNE